MMGKALLYYGKLGVSALPTEVKKIWQTRNTEIEPCEPLGMYSETMTDPDLADVQDFAQRLAAITPLTEREAQAVMLCVINNETLSDAGYEMGCTYNRVSQLIANAMRKYRKHQQTLTGIEHWHLIDGKIPKDFRTILRVSTYKNK